MSNSLIYKIAINQIPGIGSINAKKIISKLGDPELIFKEKKKNLLKIEGIGESLVNKIQNNNALEKAEKELNFIDKYNIEVLFYLDDNYPIRLKHCEDAPVVLFSKGKVNYNNPKVISIVGTRNATKYGKEICETFVKDISERNYNALIVSGLAYGIDINAHKAALKYGIDTVAVLAHGLDKIYPSAHKNYAKKIISQGALTTEYYSIEAPERQNFVKRNRIIAGLADATIVIESGKKGGALITADIANSYNRDVFAFPGRNGDIWSEGCNKLIKTNRAALIESIDDLEYIMGWESTIKKKKSIQKQLFITLSDDEQLIYNILKEHNELSIDIICLHAKMPVSKVSPLLLNLEFSGLVKSLPGNLYTLI